MSTSGVADPLWAPLDESACEVMRLAAVSHDPLVRRLGADFGAEWLLFSESNARAFGDDSYRHHDCSWSSTTEAPVGDVLRDVHSTLAHWCHRLHLLAGPRNGVLDSQGFARRPLMARVSVRLTRLQVALEERHGAPTSVPEPVANAVDELLRAHGYR